ncbi:MAG: glycosyltransferase [Bergeyella zoohelcum]|nr:glycosyltransferase [Bergeyella zoohelcum]
MKISVVVPIYNVEKYLSRCVESLISKEIDEKDYEILLVDDGSQDNSSNIAKAFAGEYPQIKYFYKENGGLGSARNFGIENAEGEYIMFVDSDDWLQGGALGLLYQKVCEGKDLDILSFDIQRVFDDGKIIKSEIDYNPSLLYSGKELVLQHRLTISPCIHLIKRDLLIKNNIRFREGIFYEDIDFCLKILLASEKILFTPDIVYQYYCNTSSITMNPDEKHHQKKMRDYALAIVEIMKIEKKQDDELAKRIAYIREGYCLLWLKMLYRENADYLNTNISIKNLKDSGVFPFYIAQHQKTTDDDAQLFYFNHLMMRSPWLFRNRYRNAVLLMKINKRINLFR